MMLSYFRSYSRFILTKVYDPRLMTPKAELNCPQLDAFDHAANMVAQAREISKEEAINELLKQFSELEDPREQEKLRRDIEEHLDAARKSDMELEAERDKYPHTYLFERLNEMVAESMNIPKIMLCKR
jgi:hypothetical protein